MIKGTFRAGLILLIAVGAGCAMKPDRATTDPSHLGPEEVSRIERERPALRVLEDRELARVIAGQGSCAPAAGSAHELTACCGKKACRGQCVEEEGGVACSCFGVVGGCAEGLVCCKFRRACTRPEECESPAE